jgi:hypothetical protein
MEKYNQEPEDMDVIKSRADECIRRTQSYEKERIEKKLPKLYGDVKGHFGTFLKNTINKMEKDDLAKK